MSSAQEIGQKFIDAFNAHAPDRIRELYGENVVFEGPSDVRLEGAEASIQYATAWLGAFPDVRLSVQNELVAGDWVTQECTIEGTHEGTLSSPGGGHSRDAQAAERPLRPDPQGQRWRAHGHPPVLR